MLGRTKNHEIDIRLAGWLDGGLGCQVACVLVSIQSIGLGFCTPTVRVVTVPVAIVTAYTGYRGMLLIGGRI